MIKMAVRIKEEMRTGKEEGRRGRDIRREFCFLQSEPNLGSVKGSFPEAGLSPSSGL